MEYNKKDIIDKENLKKLAISLENSNQKCLKLYGKYKDFFKEFKYADINISNKTCDIVYHIIEVKKYIKKLNTSLKSIIEKD